MWVDIKGYEGYYQVSNQGRFRRHMFCGYSTLSRDAIFRLVADSQSLTVDQLSKRYRISPKTVQRIVKAKGETTGFNYLRGKIDNYGYVKISLGRGNCEQDERRAHHLVLEAFVGPRPEGCHGCHLNGCRTDNRISNLCWGTPVENASHKKAYCGQCAQSIYGVLGPTD